MSVDLVMRGTLAAIVLFGFPVLLFFVIAVLFNRIRLRFNRSDS